jgi:YD repeat-containing protein
LRAARKPGAGPAQALNEDAVGNVSTVTDRDGRQQVNHCDGDNRLTAVTWLSAGAMPTTLNLLTYTSDDAGNQLTAADANGTVSCGYDALNRVRSFTNVFGQVLT